MRGRNNADRGIAGRLSFEARARVRAEGGRIEADGSMLRVAGARSIELIFAAATSFLSPTDVSGDPAAKVRTALDAAAAMPLATLRDRHVAEHRRLFRRLTIALPRRQRSLSPPAQRLAPAADGAHHPPPALTVPFPRYPHLSP